MNIDQLLHNMLVYFVPTIIFVVVVTAGWAISEHTKMKKRGWRREDEEPWDDDKE